MEYNSFNKKLYLYNLEQKIFLLLSKSKSLKLTFDILDTIEHSENKKIFLREKQKRMIIGKIWEEAIGSYFTFELLKPGNITGLDIISKELKIIVELKNRVTTDNYSAKSFNLNKLALFKKKTLIIHAFMLQ